MGVTFQNETINSILVSGKKTLMNKIWNQIYKFGFMLTINI